MASLGELRCAAMKEIRRVARQSFEETEKVLYHSKEAFATAYPELYDELVEYANGQSQLASQLSKLEGTAADVPQRVLVTPPPVMEIADPAEDIRHAVYSATGVQLQDWQLFSAGVGGVAWETISPVLQSAEGKSALIATIRGNSGGSVFLQSLSDDALNRWPTPGDLVRHAKGIATPVDDRPWWQWSDVNWAMVILLFMTHLIAVYSAVRMWSHPNFWTLLAEVMVWYPLCGMLGITACAHRLYAHKSYNAKLPARIVMFIWNCIANQGSIFHWARDHRTHHKHCDTDADPHDISRGFFFAHMGWLLLKKAPAVKEAGKAIDVSDILKCPLVRIQKACDPWWNMAFCFGLPALYAHYFYGDAFFTGFCVIGCLRWIIALHATWCVNSVAHTFGDRPYTEDMYPTQSWFTTLVAVGEGYHNYHHTYPYDYSASETGFLGCFNPTTLWIDFLKLIGQAYGLKKADHGVTVKCGRHGCGLIGQANRPGAAFDSPNNDWKTAKKAD